MTRVEAPSYPVSIFIGGDYGDAIRLAQVYCDQVGFCVTITPTRYIYTDGWTDGVVVGLINYPRFPSTPEEIFAEAETLAERLRVGLKQESYSIQAPDKTVWISFREDRTPSPVEPVCSV